MRRGKVDFLMFVKLSGAVIGAVGFFLLAYGNAFWGTTLIGLGSIIIAGGEHGRV